ncbi:DUF3427 domain-containing protein [Anaeromicropila herbilytica]|uniref:Helicase n=1 Tax=Anaeromicropila herbilytica TaxID=2785025 RepID=A0A7R7EJK9_9FIRM|nr:DEAD/DEAH box helicase [Anaeromicropila herbilytica]BCN29881.1 helicase [Anaeromicropila herbilytica]
MKEYQEDKIKEINNGLQTAYVDSSWNSNLAYRPEFISNDYKQGKKVLSSIEEELRNCDEFCISVAFITMSGITPLLQVLEELEVKNISGKILTTDYLTFSEPAALEKLSALKNIELKMFCTDSEVGGFHTKGYIFRKEEIYRIIIGSSNMTLNAITKNREWNTKIVSTEDGAVAKDILNEFHSMWKDSHTLNYSELISQYRTRYQIIKDQQRIAKKEKVASIEQYKLKPNKMQVAFINNLNKMRKNGAQRALLLSSTGTGKTYASAFALRDMNPKKALFIVHREQIAKQAIKSYQKVFGNNKSFGLLSGTSKKTDAEYMFSTMQMMAKTEIHSQYSQDEFDVIIIDEVHHAGAESYQRIMEYFKPKFWLGMTASPDTNNYDIYSIFNHQIAYEIRLQQALEEDLLCPFHYFGITDLEVNGEVFDDNTGMKNFNYLISEDRVNYIIQKAEYYGYSGERVKGLIFCSRKDEAKELSSNFNRRGYRTEYLTGEDSQERREQVIERLTDDDNANHQLDYIFTVDIFNEGVDIPEINQVIMLRPTESPVVFVQQLGRGLRKTEEKEYVVILDFIGNYKNNFMIPIALSGDRTYSKDNIRKYVMEGSRIIPGSSTIHFDEISKKRIFESINNVATTKKLLTEKYLVLKYKLGRIPSLVEFYEYGEIDPMLFIDYSGTYHLFRKMVDKDYKIELAQNENTILEFVSGIIANGKRPHELVILDCIMNSNSFNQDDIKNKLSEDYSIAYTDEAFESAIHVLDGRFLNSPSDKKKFADLEILQEDVNGNYQRVKSYYQRLQHNEFYNQLKDLIQLGLKRYSDLYLPRLDDCGLALYQKYSRKDVCRILNWERDDSSTIYGYRIKYRTCPIFVTYNKQEDIAESTKYDDQFIDKKVFSWMTRSTGNWRQESEQLMNYKDNGILIYLFVKKSDGEGSDFYYMGQCTPIEANETINTNGAPIMNIKLLLQESVQDDIYDYFTK